MREKHQKHFAHHRPTQPVCQFRFFVEAVNNENSFSRCSKCGKSQLDNRNLRGFECRQSNDLVHFPRLRCNEVS